MTNDPTPVAAEAPLEAAAPEAPLDVVQQPDESEVEALRTEVRRLQLRLDALRRQLAERLETIRELRDRLDAGEGSAANSWKERALAAEDRYDALMSTRSMRILQPVREQYGRLRERYPNLRR